MIDVGPRPITSEVDFFGSIMDPSVTVIPAEGASIRVKIWRWPFATGQPTRPGLSGTVVLQSFGVRLPVDARAHRRRDQVDRGRAEGVERDAQGRVVSEVCRGGLFHGRPDAANGDHDGTRGMQMLGDQRSGEMAFRLQPDSRVTELPHGEGSGYHDGFQ